MLGFLSAILVDTVSPRFSERSYPKGTRQRVIEEGTHILCPLTSKCVCISHLHVCGCDETH